VVSAETSTLMDVQSSANLTVVTSASLTVQGPAADNLTLLAPFGGYVKGFLDIALHEEAKGGESVVGVSFARNETHYANLPLRIGDMSEDCDRALSNIKDTVSSTVAPNCTASVVSPLIAAAASSTGASAASLGLRFAVDTIIVDVAPCSVEVTVIVTQPIVLGPAGAFSVECHQGGIFNFEPKSQPV